MEDEYSVGFICFSKESRGQTVLVGVVESTLDMTAVVFIFEAAVDDQDIVISIIVFPIENVDQSLVFNTREIVSLVIGEEMRQVELRFGFDVGNTLNCGTCFQTGVPILFHDVVRMLEHADGSPAQLLWPNIRIGALGFGDGDGGAVAAPLANHTRKRRPRSRRAHGVGPHVELGRLLAWRRLGKHLGE